MMVLKDLKPEKVMYFFEEICKIPHGSGNTKMISDFCVQFAEDRNLKYVQDEKNNIVIFKPGTAGYENSETVIIQGHLDMVCEKDKDCSVDMEKEGLRLQVRDGFIEAQGTTLGGDDGIAVAFGLAVLDSNEIEHPPLEVVFTVDEEIGMLGATDFDFSVLKGRTMLNIDSEEEGNLLVSCAGGVTATCHLGINKVKKEGTLVEIKVHGLLGGHSGVEIDKGRANSNLVMGRFLWELQKYAEYNLVSIEGGKKDNAIPKETVANILLSAPDYQVVEDMADVFNKTLKQEYRITDKDIHISCSKKNNDIFQVMDEKTGNRVITALLNLPRGIQKMSFDLPGLVQTSLNMGILKCTEDEVIMSFSVRSSISSEKLELVSRMENLMASLGGSVTLNGDYPAWEFKQDSKLRELMKDIYAEQTGKEAIVQSMHAGVECGIFADRLKGLDCVSFGPDIFDIHTTSERLPIDSVQRTWDYLLEILKRLK